MALDSVLEKQSLPQQRGLVLSSPPSQTPSREEAMYPALRGRQRQERWNSQAMHTPSIKEAVASSPLPAVGREAHFTLSTPCAQCLLPVPTPGTRFSIFSLLGTSKQELQNLKKKKKVLFVLEKSVPDSKESRGEGWGVQGRNWENSTLAV